MWRRHDVSFKTISVLTQNQNYFKETECWPNISQLLLLSQICSLQRKLWPTQITILNDSTISNQLYLIQQFDSAKSKQSAFHQTFVGRLRLKDWSSWPTYLIKLRHETFSKRCQSSIDIIFSFTAGVAENSWGEVSMLWGKFPQRCLDKTLPLTVVLGLQVTEKSLSLYHRMMYIFNRLCERSTNFHKCASVTWMMQNIWWWWWWCCCW